VAATDDKAASRTLGTITLLALTLPGVMAAHAEEPPTQGQVSVKYLHYQDGQDNRTKYPFYDGSEGKSLDRIAVNSPSVAVSLPLGRWGLDMSGLVDQVSGATPRYYSDVSGATKSPGMKDERKAGDVKVTRYLDRGAVAVGAAYSTENDYRSTALSLEGRVSSDDNNTTWNVGLAGTFDRIDPVNGKVVDEHKRVAEATIGVTQALSPRDLAQLSITYSAGRGYFSDPYKLYDQRPRLRNASIAMLRWNHQFEGLDATLRSSYRYYGDTFGIRAHTVEAEWVQELGSMFALTPSLRYYTQRAASFYYDPVADVNVYPAPLGSPEYSSADQRLSAFGALTAGLKFQMRLGTWSTDLKVERYEQRANWRAGGKGSPDIDPFHANIYQLGVATRF
jgi:Protein of unknown function (DUF3570)